MARGYLTPDDIPAALTRRWICFPNEQRIVAAVLGALLELTYPDNWELFGAITPDEIAEAMLEPILSFNASEGLCMALLAEPIILRDQKSQNTNGGGFASGSWVQRQLNTKLGDPDDIIALASNRFTVPVGRWLIKWRSPANSVNRHQTLLYNVTGSVGLGFGSSEFAVGTVTKSFGELLIDITDPLQMELQHRCQTTVNTTGLGVAGNFGTEVYAEVELYQCL